MNRAQLWNRAAAIAGKECLQLSRDRATLGMLFGVPLLQIVLFGCAIEFSPRAIPVVVVGLEDARESSALRRLSAEPLLSQVRTSPSLNQAMDELRTGKALVIIDMTSIPAGALLDASDPVL